MNVICCCLDDLLVNVLFDDLLLNIFESVTTDKLFDAFVFHSFAAFMEANTLNLYDDDYLSVEDMMAENEDHQEIQDAQGDYVTSPAKTGGSEEASLASLSPTHLLLHESHPLDLSNIPWFHLIFFKPSHLSVFLVDLSVSLSILHDTAEDQGLGLLRGRRRICLGGSDEDDTCCRRCVGSCCHDGGGLKPFLQEKEKNVLIIVIPSSRGDGAARVYQSTVNVSVILLAHLPI
ncbi:hypothetical protein DY000_02050346 [Brassica cretica]|uniref:Uncharacterized protein n=1 Tax=Brassica cretica TaxID=69181 RepID=A0ABQ7EU62_BRACR|nr:hypothetical protein DY000_02050346 [Brassica cretica]